MKVPSRRGGPPRLGAPDHTCRLAKLDERMGTRRKGEGDKKARNDAKNSRVRPREWWVGGRAGRFENLGGCCASAEKKRHASPGPVGQERGEVGNGTYAYLKNMKGRFNGNPLN